jgi:hypothetical protein
MRLKILMLIAVLLSVVGFANAQDGGCGLPEADCAALAGAWANTFTVSSGTMNLDLTLDVQSDDPMQAGTFSVLIDGGFSGGPLTAGDPTALLEAFNGELNVTIGLPESQAMMTGGASEIPLQFRLVDGVGYFNYGGLQEALGPSMDLSQMTSIAAEGWIGIDFVQAMAMQAGGGSTTNPLDAVTGGADPTASLNTVTTLAELGGQYATASRDGNTFTFSFDVSGMLADPEIVKALEDDPSFAGFASGFEGMENASLDIINTITDDGFVSELAINMSADMPASDMNPDASSVTFDMVLTFSDLNNTAAVEAPADAEIATEEDLQNSGMMGGMGA